MVESTAEGWSAAEMRGGCMVGMIESFWRIQSYPGIFLSVVRLVGTQNIEAMIPSAVGPTTDGGPHEGASLPAAPSTHCRDAPNGRPGLMP